MPGLLLPVVFLIAIGTIFDVFMIFAKTIVFSTFWVLMILQKPSFLLFLSFHRFCKIIVFCSFSRFWLFQYNFQTQAGTFDLIYIYISYIYMWSYTNIGVTKGIHQLPPDVYWKTFSLGSPSFALRLVSWPVMVLGHPTRAWLAG